MTKPEAALNHLDRYLREAGNYSVLSQQEEIGLAKKIEEKGNKLLWNIFTYDPAFISNYFSEQIPKKEAQKAPAVRALFMEELTEEDFYALLESLREMVSFVSTYKTVVETYRQKIDQDEEQVLYGNFSEDDPSYPAEESSIQDLHQKRQDLDELISAWGEPRDELAKHNLRFVVSIAKKYASQGRMSFLDCIQEGNKGLYRGVDGFDHRKGYKFITYASWWVRQEINRAISNTSRTIRIPVPAETTFNKVKRALTGLQQKNGSEYVSVEELVQATGFSSEMVIEALQQAEPASLDKLQNLEEKSPNFTLHSALEDKASVSSLELVFQGQQRSIVSHTLESALTRRELDLIKKRFGFEGEPRTLQQLGTEYGLSRERVRQLEAEVLEKLAKNKGLREIYKALKE